LNFNNINTQLISTNYPPVFKNFATGNDSTLKMKPQLTQDCFQKTTVEKANQPVAAGEINQKQKIQALYDEVFSEFVENNPILKELNYTKPELIFTDEDEDSVASYQFTDNKISITPDFSCDKYLCILKDKEGRTIEIVTGTKDRVEKFTKEQKQEGYNCETIKMNEEEKEFFYSSAFAHELRHSLQSHLVASTKGCEKGLEIHKESALALNEAKQGLYDAYKDLDFKNEQELEEFNKEVIKNGNEPNFKSFSEYQEYINTPVEKIDYCINYKPKKLLDENTELKLSSSKKDKTTLSVKNQLLPGMLAETGEETSTLEYLAQPSEVDAFHYQFEYLAKHSKNNPNIRKEVADALIEEYFAKYFDGVQNMEKYGYIPLVEKE